MSFWQNLSIRRNVIKAFKCGELYLRNYDKPILPKIKRVVHKSNYTEVVFSIPTGLSPKEFEKKDFVFNQIFGDKIELDINNKYCRLLIRTNNDLSNVYGYEVIKQQLKGKRLGVVAGMDLNGKYYSYCMTKMPHLLIAGETGSGKSTQLRQILTTFIMSYPSNKLKLYLADCKRSEFHIFRNVDHVQCVHTNARDIKMMLKEIQKELYHRSELTEQFEVANIDDLPVTHKKPYLVVCIDEFVMLRDEKEIMEILVEIVAIGRTLGVFAILSMQRPSAKIIDSTVRANLTVAMGFQLRDLVEERIVNTPGASKLKEAGQLILNTDDNYSLQAPFLDLEIAKELLKSFKVVKKKVENVKEVEKIKELTESDVFNNAN